MIIYMITHIYFSGGGFKGIAYLGVLRYLYIEKLTENIKHIAGTSIGAWFAVALALKIPIEVLEEDISKIVENSSTSIRINKDNLSGLFTNNGILSNDFMIEPFKNYFGSTLLTYDITFIDFAKRIGVNLYIHCLNINSGKEFIFSVENTPNVSVLDAVKASMCISFLFKPICIDGEYYVDAIFDYNDIFNDLANKHSLLKVILPQSSDTDSIIYPKNTSFTFLDFMFRISEIMTKNILKQKIEETFYTFVIGTLEYDSSMKFRITDKDISVDITKEDMDKMILKGFIDITKYMKKRYKDLNNTI